MRRALLAGIACSALAGFSGPALAGSPKVHVLTVQLPGGGVEQIRYTGDVPPAVVIVPGGVPERAVPAGLAAPMPAQMTAMFGPNSPFAMMDRISAEMNREAARLIRQVESLAVAPMPAPLTHAPLTVAAFGRLPPGATGYSLVSTMSGNGVCTESTEITYSGNGAPRVVSSRSGNCGPTPGTAAPASLRAVPRSVPAQAQPAGVIVASNTGVASNTAPSYARLVHAADWQH